MPAPSSPLPPPGPASRSKAAAPLDGEVLPPVTRVVNPEREPPRPPGGGLPPIRLRLGTALLAGALVATLSGAGSVEAYRWHGRASRPGTSGPSPTAVALGQLGKDVADLKATVAATRPDDLVGDLKTSVDRLRADLDGLRSANAAAVAQLTAKLDNRTTAPGGPPLAEVVARLDKLDHEPRLADIAARLDRIERQVSAPTPTGSIVPQVRTSSGQSVAVQVAAPPSAKPAKATVLDDWIVRDVYSGIALVEGRTGSIREVVPGETLPGAGEVRSIQRRGRGWIVVTSRGIIDAPTW